MTAELVRPEHLPAIAALERAAFATPWSERALELLCTPMAFGVVCMQGGEALAYAGMQTVLDEGAITNVATAPAMRRRGLGRIIMTALLARARELGVATVSLEVRVSNTPAIGLYEQFGFVRVGKRPRFYQNPVEDAYIMLLDLNAKN